MPPEPRPEYLAWIRSRPGWHSTAEIWQANQRGWDKEVAAQFCQWLSLGPRRLAMAIPAQLYIKLEREIEFLGDTLQFLLQGGDLMVYYKDGRPMWRACDPTRTEE